MFGYKLNVRHDGDFYHERPYNIVVCEDEKEAVELIIEALRSVHSSFRTSRDYLNHIKETIGEFLEAYDSNVTSYVDKYHDIWFVRQDDVFEFEFDLDNGNQQISIHPYDLDFKIENNTVFITEDKSLGY